MTYHDHHIHPLGYVSMVTGLDLFGAADFEEIVDRSTRYADTIDGAIVGQRVNDEVLAERSLPSREWLDRISSSRPVLLYRYCGHIGMANTKALELAGVGPTTPDPAGGIFDRDRSGKPTGVLRETALQVVSDALSPHAIEPDRETIVAALSDLRDVGLDSVTAMVSAAEPMWCGAGHELDTILDIAPDLPIEMNLIVITDDQATLIEAADRITRSEGPVIFGGWKEFADGSLGGHTAAMYEPFSDDEETSGTLRLDEGRATLMADTALSLGGAVAIHAIGDMANDKVIGLFEGLVKGGADPSALRLEHGSLLTDEAIERLARLGAKVSVQPAFMASEEDWLERRIGTDRMHLAYRLRSLAEAGVHLLGGSDSPVEPPDPDIGIRAAIDRHGINPSESLTTEQAEGLFSQLGLAPR